MTTYFVAAAGNNASNGTSSGTPWADTTNVNTTVYSAGDSVLFNGGDTITGHINLVAANWATPQQWNPAQINSDNTLSNSNLTATHTAVAAEDAPGYAANSVTTGKYYWETVVNGGSGIGVGIGNVSTSVGSAGSTYLGRTTDTIGYYPSGGVLNNNGTAATWAAYTSGARICHALDRTNGKYWARVGTSGNWNNNAAGDPTNSASAGNFSIPAGVTAAAVVPGFNTNVQTTDSVVAYFSAASWVGTPPAGFGSMDIGTTSPTSSVPVTFSSYGTGTATVSSGSSIGFSAVNLPGVAINNLNFTGSGIAANTADGIRIQNSQAGDTQLSGCSINNSVITGYGGFGIHVWGTNGKSGFATVSITNCISHDNTGNSSINVTAGIAVYSDGAYLTGTPAFGPVTITGCTAYNNTGTAGAGNGAGHGIVCGQGNSVTISTCLTYNNGTNGTGSVGVFIYDTNAYTVSFCESHHNRTTTTHDGDGFNCDTNSGAAGLLEYCYAHDNEGFGYLFDTYIGINTVTMRYCISQNNSVKGTSSEICMTAANNTTLGVKLNCVNNTIYSAQPLIIIDANVSWVNITGTIANNIFYAASGAKFISYGAAPPTGAPTNLIFDGNNYFPTGTFSLDWNATNYASLAAWKAAFAAQEVHSGSFSTANPTLNSPGGGGTVGGYAPPQPTAYDLNIGSPEVGVGLNLNSLYSINPGPIDFYGTAIPHGVGTGYNVGAFGSVPFSVVFSDALGGIERSLTARSANEQQRTVWWS